MAYDIFISYSRKDKEKAESLCAALEKAGISYWIDRNIQGSINYLSEITTYIKSCKVVIFVASHNSANSEWTQKEILFALKHKKEIIPYRIGDFRFEDNDVLDFVFTNAQWVESVQAVIESLKKLGVQSSHHTENETNKTDQVIEPTPVPKPTPIPSKTYKVGDYYDDGTKQGVVFEVTADGKHGKIVSLTESPYQLQWAVDKDFGSLFNRDNPSENLIGADDEYNGAKNMWKVRWIVGWREKYPAFAWCADLGEGWYLPAIGELKKFTLIKAVRDAVNRTLDAKGEKIANRGVYHGYWSSTEYYTDINLFWAWGVNMRGGTYRNSKYFDYYVRAVSTF